jgi:hypothetical protein
LGSIVVEIFLLGRIFTQLILLFQMEVIELDKTFNKTLG